MKINKLILVVFAILFIVGCGEKAPEHDFVISGNNPAIALTIGWYAPVEILKEIVGPDFNPKVVNDKNESSIMLFIVKSNQHIVNGYGSGTMEAAHLIIPVERSGELQTTQGTTIDNIIVCPMTIVDQSQRLGDKYKEFGFATYTGEIDLDINQTGEKYMVEASIKTANGLIEISSMFEEDGELRNLTSAIFATKPGLSSYFYGNERFKRFSNGKGNLKTEGQNIITAMNLNGHPYFLNLDTDFSWEFDFASSKP